ncbi:MAG: hypothetical protein JWO87_3306 [Phycisphaerales bacterium]|nr:hypothetical protein [Phycisphaerales bacterium]
MRYVGLRVVCVVLAFVTLCAPARGAECAGHFAFERGDGLWGRVRADGAAELLSDKAHYQKADHHGSPCYVLHRWDEKHSWIKVLECDPAGELKRVHTIMDESMDRATAIMGASFLRDERLVIDLHINPILGVMVALDLKTDRQMVLTGNTFTWDEAGTHVAYFRDPPRSESVGTSSAELWMDGKKLCDVPDLGGRDLEWDAKGKVLTAIFPPSGKKGSRTLQVKLGEAGEVRPRWR